MSRSWIVLIIVTLPSSPRYIITVFYISKKKSSKKSCSIKIQSDNKKKKKKKKKERERENHLAIQSSFQGVGETCSGLLIETELNWPSSFPCGTTRTSPFEELAG